MRRQFYPPNRANTTFGVWGGRRNQSAKFQLYRLGVTEPRVAENHVFPLTSRIGLITVLTCYAVIVFYTRSCEFNFSKLCRD